MTAGRIVDSLSAELAAAPGSADPDTGVSNVQCLLSRRLRQNRTRARADLLHSLLLNKTLLSMNAFARDKRLIVQGQACSGKRPSTQTGLATATSTINGRAGGVLQRLMVQELAGHPCSACGPPAGKRGMQVRLAVCEGPALLRDLPERASVSSRFYHLQISS